METAPDDVLVRAARRGDERAFALLVRRYLRRGMAVALEYAETRADAEDTLQECFVRIWESLDRYDPARPFQPWFFTILRNTARNAAAFRRRRSHEAIGADQVSAEPDPFEQTRRRALRATLLAAVGRLPRMQQRCFRLCAVEGFSSGEAAAALGVAESTVRVHLFKAREALRGPLEAWREEVDAT